ncbi:MAG: DUF6512 family protein [Anaeroplasma sp.]|nr:DUF6512 family protein [Anaeroplasma sp.]
MKKINLVIAFIVISALGILFYFMYDWIGLPFLKALFPSNESIFEHLKLIIFPSLIYMGIEKIIFKDESIFSSYVSGIIVSAITMIASYYTYSGIVGADIPVVNIIIFFVCVSIVLFYRYKKISIFDNMNSVIAFVILLCIIEIFSFYPPDINLFKETFLDWDINIISTLKLN